MKLIYRITLRISLVLLLLLTAWAFFFYYIIVDEINDETDDALEDYAELIITRALAGEELPSQDNGSNNSYYLTEISVEYAALNEGIRYTDEMVYVEAKRETEPARVLKTIFRDREGSYYQLTVLIPTIEKTDLQEAMLSWIVLLYLLLLVSILVVLVGVLIRSLRPLYHLLEWLDGFTVGKPYRPLENPTKVTEFRKLNEAVIRSARRNEEMYEQQKQFIGNASHEMQTPLAICLNRLEVLADDPALTEGQLGEILKTRKTLDYVIRLNKALLLLSKIDNRQFPDTQSVAVAVLIRSHLADYAEVFAYRRIAVDCRVEGSPSVEMNEMLATVLFTNLLKNAYVHNREGGTIRIEITPSQVLFRNSATGGALDPDRIFKRFYQGSKREGSTGLGLALVEAIAKLYGMRIVYSFEAGDHLFTLILPPE